MSTASAPLDRFLAAIHELHAVDPPLLLEPTTDRERAARRLVRMVAACAPSSDDAHLAGLLVFLAHPTLTTRELRELVTDSARSRAEEEPSMAWLRHLASGLGAEGRLALRSTDEESSRRVMAAFVNVLLYASHAGGDWGLVGADASDMAPGGTDAVLASVGQGGVMGHG